MIFVGSKRVRKKRRSLRASKYFGTCSVAPSGFTNIDPSSESSHSLVYDYPPEDSTCKRPIYATYIVGNHPGTHMLDKERKSENEVTGADIRNLSHPLQMAGFSSIAQDRQMDSKSAHGALLPTDRE